MRVAGRVIVDELSFTICAGSVGALVGASGSGTTTLARCIAGQEMVGLPR